MWRPENWEEIASWTDPSGKGHPDRGYFEAGADAMLVELLNDKNVITVWRDTITTPGFMTDLAGHTRSLGNGTWVFIPEVE